jgi:hypothetical protein
VKPIAIVGIIIAVIIAIVIGLIAYSYTQIQISLQNISYQSLDVSLTAGSIGKAILNGILGNWLGAILDQTVNPGETKSIEDTQDIQFSSLKPAIGSIIDSGGIANIKISGIAYFRLLGLSVPVPFQSTKQVNVADELKSRILGSSRNSAYSNTYQPPQLTEASINLQASVYSVTEGQQISFSGRLTDSSVNGIPKII